MTLSLEDQTCLDCRFFISDGNHLTGECHRRPPEIVRRPEREESRHRGVWPAIDVCDWCGEFQEKDDVDDEVES